MAGATWLLLSATTTARACASGANSHSTAATLVVIVILILVTPLAVAIYGWRRDPYSPPVALAILTSILIALPVLAITAPAWWAPQLHHLKPQCVVVSPRTSRSKLIPSAGGWCRSASTRASCSRCRSAGLRNRAQCRDESGGDGLRQWNGIARRRLCNPGMAARRAWGGSLNTPLTFGGAVGSRGSVDGRW
jgi:hypothetical protein